MGLLFAADRLAHSREIDSHLAAGEHVVCDRYLLSSMAYQTLDESVTGEWVIEVNAGCTIPHLTLFLSAPVDVCLTRIRSRGGEASIYETRAQLESIARNYERLLLLYAARFGPVVTIDGTKPIDQVHDAVVAAVESL
jgi:dTMP kinase